jgi:hypothetical protein
MYGASGSKATIQGDQMVDLSVTNKKDLLQDP